ncbi:MAG: hypothetical protein NC037_06705 [Bacteroides sp.]|nr:hypothetical protein [Bacillota bacterium]MCM1393532.1 hypothetical protein [[Eubacterium] siraeum]MCM1456195.1 hypothetical protein [Bacteroides sp.]
MDDILLEPLKAYKDVYEKKFDENAKNYFKSLVGQSAIDVAKNRETVAEHKKELSVLNELTRKLSGQKALRGFLIFLAVGGFVMLGIGIYFLVIVSTTMGAILTPIGAALAIVTIAVTATVLKSKIQKLQEECQTQDKIANDLKTEAWRQMAPLNALFESNVTKKLIEETVPLIQIDDNFNMRRYDYLSGKYGFGDNADNRRSTIAILTGEILGNPFVVDRELVQSVGSETYTGTLVITWTTTYRDNEGHTHTQHHSQTLVASVTKPKPVYSTQTRLIYGNEAAPDLTFSHSPSHAERMSEKELESKVKSGAKKIERKQNKQLDNDRSNFTGMGNEEFDVLFGALDRDNEVQFRLLFTPLAQRNMLSLMKDKETSFGDDFHFYKSKCLNYISSEHSRNWDLDTDYSRYQSYDVDDAFNRFMAFNRNYFKSLYFDLAPLMSIPLYQQHKPREYIYMDVYPRNYTSYESEYAVNKMGQNMFSNSLSRTQSILKTSFLKKDGKSDELQVTAHSFTTEDRVELVPTLGGDGHMHAVPVHWLEYIPVQRESRVKLKQLDMSDKQFGNRLNEDKFKSTLYKFGGAHSFSHGLLCSLVGDGDLSFDRDIDEVL